jgi:hypothetical protein
MATTIRELDALERLHADFGFTYEALADALRTTTSTVHRWRAGDGGAPTPVYLHRLAAIGAFFEELDLLMDRAGAVAWMDTALPYLKGQTPRQLIMAGHVDRVTGLVMAMNAGMPL